MGIFDDLSKKADDMKKQLENDTKKVVEDSKKVVEDAEKIGTIFIVNTNTSPLNVRKGPGQNFEVIGQLQKGSKVEVLDVKNPEWFLVKQGNIQGYASTQYLKKA